MPPELMYGSQNLPRLTQSRYSAELKQSLDDVYTQVRERMGYRQKDDEKVHGKLFEHGDRVWLHCPAAPRDSPRKLQTPQKGQFRILTKLSNVNYRTQNISGNTPKNDRSTDFSPT